MSRATIAVDDIDLSPSRFWCLHVTEFTSTDTSFGVVTGPNWSQIETLYEELTSRFQKERLNAIFAEPASINSMRRRFFRPPKVIEWLTQNTRLSASQAAKVIDDLPIHVSPKMCQNARNPTQFLGIAAAILNQPDVIIYSTSGMDPRGISLIHEYARIRFTDGCLIHIATTQWTDTPCSHGGDCLVINPLRPRSQSRG